MLLAVDISGAVRRVLPKGPWNCGQLGVVVHDGVDGVDGVGAENRAIHKKKVASELLFFFRVFEQESTIIVRAERVAKRGWRISSRRRDRNRRLRKNGY
jgi:hypothetical protein